MPASDKSMTSHHELQQGRTWTTGGTTAATRSPSAEATRASWPSTTTDGIWRRRCRSVTPASSWQVSLHRSSAADYKNKTNTARRIHDPYVFADLPSCGYVLRRHLRVEGRRLLHGQERDCGRRRKGLRRSPFSRLRWRSCHSRQCKSSWLTRTGSREEQRKTWPIKWRNSPEIKLIYLYDCYFMKALSFLYYYQIKPQICQSSLLLMQNPFVYSPSCRNQENKWRARDRGKSGWPWKLKSNNGGDSNFLSFKDQCSRHDLAGVCERPNTLGKQLLI